MANFSVGQKVVCVNDEFNPRAVIRGTSLPKRGQIYTVREIVVHSLGETIRLREIVNAHGVYLHDDTGEFLEAAFPSFRFRFRPLVERKTDISIFTAMLNPSKVEERV